MRLEEKKILRLKFAAINAGQGDQIGRNFAQMGDCLLCAVFWETK
jgi:hypothetical protein